jgi:type I restriction enzyme R subunit
MSEWSFTESVVEDAALAWLESLGYAVKHGPDITPGGDTLTLTLSQWERENYSQVVLADRLRQALSRLNPSLPPDAIDDAFRKVTRLEGATLDARNRAFHRLLVDGVNVEYRLDGTIRGAQAALVDFNNPDNNDWLAVNQFTVVENKHNRRPDVVFFLNGLPLGVIELKNAADEDATIWDAFHQLQTYQAEISLLFAYNAVLIISDGVQARIGSLGTGREWFKPWRTITGESLADPHIPELQVLIQGVFDKRRFLDLVRYFVVFEDFGGGAVTKKMAGYHQFHAVNVAVQETLRAARMRAQAEGVREPAGLYKTSKQPGGKPGDRRVGVVWHTQGSGKSLTMSFYAGRVILEPDMANPTLVVLTDRNDLDDQLFGTFSRCQELLRQPPIQATSRQHLRKLLRVESGGVIFTTIQKFIPPEPSPQPSPSGRGRSEAEGEGTGDMPCLSERRNIVVIADEAHRSQYDFIDGFARHMRDALPNASFIGFTGTPIELTDKNTRAVFGDYISVYDIQRAVEDKATVPIYYESRLAKLELDEAERPKIDPDFEEATEGEEVDRKEKLKSKWAQLEAVVGAGKRLRLIAQDIVDHFEKRAEAMLRQTQDEGKSMIVCMSRRICVELYREIIKLQPNWHDDGDEKGVIKVVMTGSASDPVDWQMHIRNKPRREELAKRFRNPSDPFKVAIVRDMWLTGFDAPSLHTM